LREEVAGGAIRHFDGNIGMLFLERGTDVIERKFQI
jgi:hypothetical protein